MLNLLFVIRLLVFAGTFGVYHLCDYCGGYWTAKNPEAVRYENAGRFPWVTVKPVPSIMLEAYMRVYVSDGRPPLHICSALHLYNAIERASAVKR